MNKINLISIARNSILGMIIAVTLIFGTACKKKIDTEAPNNLGEKVHITLKVNNGSKGVDPSTGVVTFGNNDGIWVGTETEDQACGLLYYDDSEGKFSGVIDPVEGEYLYFYYIGGVDWYDYNDEEYLFYIGDQDVHLPVLSCGRSNVVYETGVTSYSCTMYNQCALVNFTLPDETGDPVELKNVMNTYVTIDYATHEIREATSYHDNQITLYSENETSKWAILLPMSGRNGTITINGDDYHVTIPTIEANDYLTGEDAIEIGEPVHDNYLFSVSATEQVCFSPGNLQYKDGEGWRFAEHQYDAICSWNTSDWVDLFGWGTWGSGKDPLNESENWEDYQWSTDFQGELDGYNDWRTLTTNEWQYLFNSRTDAGEKYASATVNGIHGIVLLPDTWTLPGGCSFTADMNGWDNNTYDVDAWASMEANGAVFLPAAGYRYGTDVSDVGDDGYYWSSSAYDENNAWYVYSYNSVVNPDNYDVRFYGLSVRLVRPAE
ncbi:MAG: hypothetical protein J5708_01690 [Bacteroidales bacterium]|nr:hypothetical protein [Bacteroidales bacterium]